MTVSIITPATKYRVAIRDIAISHGWEFTQIATSTDRFTKGGATIDVHHGPSNLITVAEKVDGKSITKTSRSGKMFDVQAWLTGTPDPDRTNYIRLTEEQIRAYESGQGKAKIAVIDAPAPTKPAPAPAPAKSAAKPAPKAEVKAEVKAPAPKPAPRAAKKAPAAK